MWDQEFGGQEKEEKHDCIVFRQEDFASQVIQGQALSLTWGKVQKGRCQEMTCGVGVNLLISLLAFYKTIKFKASTCFDCGDQINVSMAN